MIVPKWVHPFKPGCKIRHDLFLDRIYDYPGRYWHDKVAIRDGDRKYTFGELQRKTLGLSVCLIARGVKKGDRIVVVAVKCAEMAIIAAGIWKAGAVYVPVDPANPRGRNDYLIGSIEPRLVMAPRSYAATTGFSRIDIPVIFFDDAVNYPMTEMDTEPVFPEVSGADLAYIMHTSGSTGQPKGVMIEHGSVVDYFYNHNLVLQFTEQSYCLSNAPFYFDVSIEDTFLPLSVGAAVYQYRGIYISAIFLGLLGREGITHLIAVSTILKLITGDGKKLSMATLPHLDMVMTGAEVCDTRIINQWKRAFPHVRLVNVYGPTETTIVCTAYTIDRADDMRSEFYPIGRPLAGVKAILMDDNDLPVTGPGERGMLWIGGRQVMRGYWKDDVLTRKVLVQYENDIYYKTGDICYYDAAGELVFSGRNDEEIKLNGRRINMMEIKKALLRGQSVTTAAVGVIEVNAKSVLAAVICADGIRDESQLQALREKLVEELPGYMVPEYIGLIDDPLLSHTGKNNEKLSIALLKREVDRSQCPFVKISI